MKAVYLITVLFVGHTVAYHDPDLNYHLNQLQKTQPCDDNGGYSYAPPTVQLTSTGIKTQAITKPTNSYLPPSAPTTYQSSDFSAGVVYQAAAQKATYSQPITYNNVVSHAYTPALNNQIQQTQKEVHGYATSAGLSAAASSGRTVIPSPTYAQAPIIAKITGAPLIANFATAPAKTTFVTQRLGSQTSYETQSLAKASLYKSVQSSGPVVTQVFAAPASQYVAAPTIQVQQQPKSTQLQVIQYSQPAQQVTSQAKAQYASSTIHVAQNSQYGGQAIKYSYAAPTVSQQYSAPAVQYSAPVVTQQYAAPVAQYQYSAQAFNQYLPPVQHSSQTMHSSAGQYAAPVMTQYFVPAEHSSRTAQSSSYGSITQHSSQAAQSYGSITQHSSQDAQSSAHYGGITHVSAPAVSLSAPSVSLVSPVAVAHAAPIQKNVHAEFLENYDAHPRYAYEYRVHDPHTGDIKHQKEERDGEVVKGQYSLVEPDGSVRTVDYVADWETGFHAAVRNSKDNQH